MLSNEGEVEFISFSTKFTATCLWPTTNDALYCTLVDFVSIDRFEFVFDFDFISSHSHFISGRLASSHSNLMSGLQLSSSSHLKSG